MTTLFLDEILGRATAESPNEIDVVFGRGGYTNRHPGNQFYLGLISQHEESYLKCPRKYQKLMGLCIIHTLRCQGARFLKKDSSNVWTTVKLSQCRLKVSQRLREKAPFIKLQAKRVVATKKHPPAAVDDAAVNDPPAWQCPGAPMEFVISTVTEDDEDSSSFVTGGHSRSSSLESSASVFASSWEGQQGKRSGTTTFEEPRKNKRPRTLSYDARDHLLVAEEEEPVNTNDVNTNDFGASTSCDELLKEASLLDDISICSMPFEVDDDDDFLQDLDFPQLDAVERASPAVDDMLDYLQVLF